ncbi:MAG TPA: sugar phosphate isomerase/epimerase [Nitrososphaeria archaeon]|nr:sugar phosphate isomerase/epimerase [Nitrososphaeria archaeon]
MLRLGFPVWYGYGGRIRELAREAARVGFDYLEISLDYPWPFKGRLPLREVVETAAKEDLSPAFHLPWRDVRPASPLEDVRRSSLKVLEKVVAELSGFECEYLVAHVSTDQALDKIDEITGEVVEAAVESIRSLRSFSEAGGLRLVIENVREDLKTFLEIVSRSGAHACLDVGHAVCSIAKRMGREAVERELSKWFDSLRDRIRVIHYSGIRFGNGWVRDHQLTSSADRYLRFTKSRIRGLSLRNLLLEVFEGPGDGEVKPSQLADAVSFLKEI